MKVEHGSVNAPAPWDHPAQVTPDGLNYHVQLSQRSRRFSCSESVPYEGRPFVWEKVNITRPHETRKFALPGLVCIGGRGGSISQDRVQDRVLAGFSGTDWTLI